MIHAQDLHFLLNVLLKRWGKNRSTKFVFSFVAVFPPLIAAYKPFVCQTAICGQEEEHSGCSNFFLSFSQQDAQICVANLCLPLITNK